MIDSKYILPSKNIHFDYILQRLLTNFFFIRLLLSNKSILRIFHELSKITFQQLPPNLFLTLVKKLRNQTITP
jgi:hypothetical protein